ncbi:4'-phosphopantetheinyl transferase family protein [Pseudooceanicola sp. LIPI14-2-Ac024]|uniref:4'-phosphopantetheinyl transferase family protein n=1 Tax=Pseudooceanicola sp. LIPI14-2-Ac024 TaxID=3344875 RepID=UPI0035D0BB69
MPIDIALHLWRLDDAAEGDRLARHLDDGELARADRFVRPRDGLAYRIGRGRLREVLGAVTGTPPAALRFTYGAHGKPALPDGPEFNLSHSGALACLAIADRPLGADIEVVRPIEDAVAERFFAPGEYAALSQLDGTGWVRGFHRCWTRKEAVVKAMGDGLSIPLDLFDVTLGVDEPPRMTRLAPALGRADDWRFLHLEVGDDILGAVAMQSGGAPIRGHVVAAPEGLAVQVLA